LIAVLKSRFGFYIKLNISFGNNPVEKEFVQFGNLQLF
jgi:hypothetical protein